MNHKNNLYLSKAGNRVIVTGDNGKVVRFIIERPGVAGCESRKMAVADFENLELTFVRKGKFVI